MRLTWVVELLMVSATGKDIIKSVSPNIVCLTVCIHISSLYVVSIHLSLYQTISISKVLDNLFLAPFSLVPVNRRLSVAL